MGDQPGPPARPTHSRGLSARASQRAESRKLLSDSDPGPDQDIHGNPSDSDHDHAPEAIVQSDANSDDADAEDAASPRYADSRTLRCSRSSLHVCASCGVFVWGIHSVEVEDALSSLLDAVLACRVTAHTCNENRVPFHEMRTSARRDRPKIRLVLHSRTPQVET